MTQRTYFFIICFMRNLFSAQTKMEVKQAGLRLPPSQLQIRSVHGFFWRSRIEVAFGYRTAFQGMSRY